MRPPLNRPPIVRRTLGPSLVAGALAGVFSWSLVIVLGMIARALLGNRAPYGAVIALSCLATVPLVARVARRKDGGSAVRPACWVLLAWFPYLLGGAAFDLSNPIVEGHWRCGTGDIGLFGLALVSVPVVFATALAIGVAFDRFRLLAATKRTAWAVVLVSMVVLAVSAHRRSEVAPADYLASLPKVAEFTHYDDRFFGPGFVVMTEGPTCVVLEDVSDTKNAIGIREAPSWNMPFYGGERRFELPGDCFGVRVMHDEAHDLWVLRGGAIVAGQVIDRHVVQAEITVSKVASSLRPPTAWIAALTAGSMLALFLLARARRTLRRAAEWKSARPGVHEGAGWITFADGMPPAHFAGAAALPVCQVLVLEGSRKSPHYREHGRVDEGARFATGIFDHLVQDAEARATDLQVVATLITLLTLAPMVAAALDGLLG
jgi:hypothetical protein